jgi:hypothetical protein
LILADHAKIDAVWKTSAAIDRSATNSLEREVIAVLGKMDRRSEANTPE